MTHPINVMISGATGMVGKGVLLECLESPMVKRVLVVNRKPLGIEHEKLKELIVNDFYDLTEQYIYLTGYNACFFCLGVSAVGMKEAEYHRITYDLTKHFAETVSELNAGMVFCYVSGAGTDAEGKSMWARVKGKTENMLKEIKFKDLYLFRPGIIQPKKGVRSKTAWYNAIYVVMSPILPLLKAVFPSYITTTVLVGQAMIKAATVGSTDTYLENQDINKLALKQP